ncbi:MAG: hypothetical protein K9M84_01380 [Spirochaetia bacterium]|nr:hypothetical protein [Spirochaetia bacterium]MCF7940242.1 hypothetical protein [Spirochaetia bacterium]
MRDTGAMCWVSRLELVVRCAIDEMYLINREASNGKRLHNRLWNGQGEIRLTGTSGIPRSSSIISR